MSQKSQAADARVTKVVQLGKWNLLSYECEKAELDVMSEAFERPSTFFYCSFLLAYLIENDLNNARFLWKRIPADIKKNNAMLGTIWSIGRSMWEKQYAKTYEIVSQTNWDTALVPLINRLVETFRQRTAKLLTTAYTSISASDVSLYLGMNEQDVTKYVAPLQWTYDDSTKFWTPNKDFLTAQQVQEQRSSGIQTLQGLAEKTVFLELD